MAGWVAETVAAIEELSLSLPFTTQPHVERHPSTFRYLIM